MEHIWAILLTSTSPFLLNTRPLDFDLINYSFIFHGTNCGRELGHVYFRKVGDCHNPINKWKFIIENEIIDTVYKSNYMYLQNEKSNKLQKWGMYIFNELILVIANYVQIHTWLL